ncbi:murein transglycosylase A [Neosynechococcus sphagnicola]|uniref:murein transglycosylase A n=1 Tax=Neosynechococcus sphagnicola TaxID=1501145 RepID=UPI00068FDE05|nr:MltA domain-containing protein [Neosynechococcus sphagnicola]
MLNFGSPRGTGGDRAALVTAIDRSLQYLSTDQAAAVYRRYPIAGVTHRRVERSLQRFRQLLLKSTSPSGLQQAVQREFAFYQASGQDHQGTVAFTGYFQPIYAASRVPTAEFRYPLYRLPSDFDRWATPHPTREQLEGRNGLGTKKLRGLELAWLRDRFQAFLVQVQGSARLLFPDGSVMSLGYAGRTQYPYTGVGRELVKDGKIPLEALTLPTLVDYFIHHPEAMDDYLPRNQSFVFFKETWNRPATGSLGVPVTAERSIATDKTLMPPGALALIQAPIPTSAPSGQQDNPWVNRFVLDQDTGNAIRGPGRVDIFMGTGPQASDRAGLINSKGRLYYLLLR